MVLPLTRICMVSSATSPLLHENDISVSGRLLLSEFRFIGLRNSVQFCRDHLNVLKLPPSSGSHNSNTSVLSTPTICVVSSC